MRRHRRRLSPPSRSSTRSRALGGEAVANGDSVADFEGAERLIQTAIDTFGDLHVVVNNAGILRDRVLANMTEEEWDAVINVHLKGTFAPSPLRRRLLARAGQGRQAGQRPDHQHDVGVGHLRQPRARRNYGAAKAGIAAFTNIAALEVARYGVTVNAVAPGRPHPHDRGPRPGAGDRRGARGARRRTGSPRSSRGWRRRSPPASPAACSRRPASSSPSPRAGSAARRPTPIDDPTQLGDVVAELLAEARPNSRHGRQARLLAADPTDARSSEEDRHAAEPRRRRRHRASPPRSAGRARTPCSTPSASAPAQDELAFTTENTNGVDQLVFPTFPVVIGWGKGSAMGKIGSFNPALLVHGQQAVTLHRPIPVEGTATLVERVIGDVRQGQGGRRRHRDRGDDGRRAALHEPQRRRSSAARAAGAASAARPGPQNVPPDRAPDHEVTLPDVARPGVRVPAQRRPQPAAHRPAFAAMGGFDRPILHGLCSYGFTGRALLHPLCGSDPARFHHIEARFASPVHARRGADGPGVGDRRRRGRVHDVGRRPRRHRPGPAALQLSHPSVPGRTPVRIASTLRRRRTTARRPRARRCGGP